MLDCWTICESSGCTRTCHDPVAPSSVEAAEVAQITTEPDPVEEK